MLIMHYWNVSIDSRSNLANQILMFLNDLKFLANHLIEIDFNSRDSIGQ